MLNVYKKKYTDYYLQPVIILVCYVIHFEISLVLNVIIKCSNIRLVLLECYILCCHLMEIESCGAERLMSLLWFVCWIHSCTRFDRSLCWPGREKHQIDYWVYCVCAFFSTIDFSCKIWVIVSNNYWIHRRGTQQRHEATMPSLEYTVHFYSLLFYCARVFWICFVK